ncbi:uncharacterized protein LOC110900587 [Helianthus annuus]|uniref:uncharacterized protein LOC110900587 n=1 Tax=Helianthus annuus TaxID=4232 RepID=UPI000B9032B4|nr:uncharacterized protein LOC110900587 [Helianthus annuus]
MALMSSHIWSILTNRKSLWVDWVHSYRLKGKSFWECRIPSSCCWSWRKLLHLRPIIRKFIWTEIGNGSTTSAWFDSWCKLGPLNAFISPRIIANAGFDMGSKVSDIYSSNSWNWPNDWRVSFPVLNQLDQLILVPNKPDKLRWRHGDNLFEFSSSRAWESIRIQAGEVDWSRIVWFPQCIPRHAFLMWLIMRQKLLTQDRILSWDFSRRKNMNMMCCLLCYANHDSHSHLFFECKYSSQVWHKVRQKVGMVAVQPIWNDITNWLIEHSKPNTAVGFVARLVVAASAYFIWQERNSRLFKNQLRPPETLSEIVLQQVRYKLMGAKLKNCVNVRRLLEEWGIEGSGVLAMAAG